MRQRVASGRQCGRKSNVPSPKWSKKREAEQLEIVAFGAISSGKSSLLNALAGRDVFRTNVVGGTTVTHSQIAWPGSDKVVLTDTPGLAEVSGESRAREAAEAAKNAGPCADGG